MLQLAPRPSTENRRTRRRYGVGTPAEAIEAPPRRVILFPGTGNIVNARQIAQLTAGLRACLPERCTLLIGVDQEERHRLHGSTASSPSIPGALVIGQTGDAQAPAARVGSPRGTQRARQLARLPRPVADRERQPEQPGHLGRARLGNDPEGDLRTRPVGAAIQGLPRRWRRDDSGVPVTATPTWTTAPPPADHRPHAAPVGLGTAAAGQGHRQRRRRHHERPHRDARARPIERPGHAVARRSSPGCCAANSASG